MARQKMTREERGQLKLDKQRARQERMVEKKARTAALRKEKQLVSAVRRRRRLVIAARHRNKPKMTADEYIVSVFNGTIAVGASACGTNVDIERKTYQQLCEQHEQYCKYLQLMIAKWKLDKYLNVNSSHSI